MAKLKNITLDNGLTAKLAYHRINSVSGTQDNMQMSVTAYVSREFYLENKTSVPLVIEYHDFTPDVSDDSNNIFKQGYLYLGTLDEYIESIDILEVGQQV